jgi:predicted nucleotidyltransferase
MNVILESIVGSTAYGLNTKDSDVDTLGIYVRDTEDFHGLDLFTEKDFSMVTTNPDRTLHEVGKFCRLALRCNPTVTELLWVPERLLVTSSEYGEALRELKYCFLSASLVRSAYLGYAHAQFERLTERGDFGADLRKRTEKHARHLLRLMQQGYELYSTGHLSIEVINPEIYHEFGRRAALDPEVARDHVDYYSELFEETRPAIPEAADRDTINDFLKILRGMHFNAHSYSDLRASRFR